MVDQTLRQLVSAQAKNAKKEEDRARFRQVGFELDDADTLRDRIKHINFHHGVEKEQQRHDAKKILLTLARALSTVNAGPVAHRCECGVEIAEADLRTDGDGNFMCAACYRASKEGK